MSQLTHHAKGSFSAKKLTQNMQQQVQQISSQQSITLVQNLINASIGSIAYIVIQN
jgi:hypothetical protein